MALIPSDVGLRLRQQNELLTQPVAPVQEIPEHLADFKTGQAFSARIQEVLPENTYRALVAGKTVTLSLPEAAKNGDVLELVVVDRTPKSIMAQLAPNSANASNTATTGATPYPHATFSSTAQMLGKLLMAEGDTPKAAALNRGEPLMTQAPRNGTDLAPVLSKAVSESGLFYESHQAQWVAGKLPLANLLQEPQGRLSHPETLANQATLGNSTKTSDAEANTSGKAANPAGANTTTLQSATTLLLNASNAEHNATGPNTPATQQSLGAAQTIPDDLRPLVQQQLDAAGTQRLIWHGEVWPGQTMQWEIDQEAHNAQNSDETGAEPWLSTLRLSTPNLGQLEAALQLGPRGVRIVLSSESSTVANEMHAAVSQLEQSLAAAGVTLLGLTVKQLQTAAVDAANAGASDTASDADAYAR